MALDPQIPHRAVVEVADLPRPGLDAQDPGAAPSRAVPHRVFGWLLPPLLVASVIAGIALVRSGPTGAFGWVLFAVLAPLFLWLVVSVLWPARADRDCPDCGAESLVRLDADTTCGVGCSGCGWADPNRSSWLLAEEEGPLEPLVLAQRRSRKPVDIGNATD